MTNAKLTATQKLARLQAESAKSGPCCSLWSRGVDCGCADAAELDAAFGENDDEPVIVAANPVHLYDRSTAQVLLVLGGDTPAALPGIHGVRVLRLGDGEERWYSRATLEQGDRFVAVCRHAYTLNDSCPGCDADEADELLSTTPPAREYFVAHVDAPDVPLLVLGATSMTHAGRPVPGLTVRRGRFDVTTNYADRFTAYPAQAPADTLTAHLAKVAGRSC